MRLFMWEAKYLFLNRNRWGKFLIFLFLFLFVSEAKGGGVFPGWETIPLKEEIICEESRKKDYERWSFLAGPKAVSFVEMRTKEAKKGLNVGSIRIRLSRMGDYPPPKFSHPKEQNFISEIIRSFPDNLRDSIPLWGKAFQPRLDLEIEF